MAEIYDLIAKVSWETNEQELARMNSTLKNQDKVLEELRVRGRKLEEQLIKTNDPKKVTALNNELKKTAQAADAIVANQKKQVELTQKLQAESKKLGQDIRANLNNPQATQGLLRQLHAVDNQLTALSGKFTSLPNKFAGLGQSLLGGIGLGAGMFGADALIRGTVGFLSDSIDEILEAEKATRNLGLALEAIGQKKYLSGLLEEATELSQKFNNIYDNDEIAQAQTEFVKYGKVTRSELKQLTEVSIELASKLGIDVVSASNKVIDILAGRGASTLRDFGLSTKDAKTETERMNLVLVDLANKVKGASEAYATSAEGIKKQNELIIANTKEQIGEKLLPIYIDMLKGINDLLSGEMDKIGGIMLKGTQNIISLIIPEVDYLKKLYNSIFKEEKETDVIGGLKSFYATQFELRKQAFRDSNKKMAEERDKIEGEDNKKEDKKANAKANAKVQTVKKENKEKLVDYEAYYDQLGQLDAEYQILLDLSSKRAIGRVEKENKRRLEANEKARQQELDLIKENIDAELPDDVAQRQKEREEGVNSMLYNINLATNEVNAIIELEQRKNDRLIYLQEERLQNAKKTSDASVKVEQDRLNVLLDKRKKYERAQRVIDAGVITANQALAISGAITQIANSKNPVLIAANVLAIIAGIAATTTAIRGAFQDTGFKEGGYTGDGNPNETSTKLGRKPYTYHKREFVMDADLTDQNRAMFESLHKRKLKVNRLDDGSYYLAPDVYKLASDYDNAKHSGTDLGLLAEMRQMRKLMEAREVRIENNFDADGFGQSVATQLGYSQIKQKRRG